MSEGTDKQPPGSAEASPSKRRKSGRVAFDQDGRSIWEWQTATGIFTRNVTEAELSRLASVELELIEAHPRDHACTQPYGSHFIPSRTQLPRRAGLAPAKENAANRVAQWLFRKTFTGR